MIKKDITTTNIAEDIRKLNHCALVFALNQSEDEKEKGIYRIKKLIGRHSETTSDEVAVLSQLAIGRPFLNSYKKRELDLYT